MSTATAAVTSANRASWRSGMIRAGAAAAIASGLLGLALAPVPESYLAAWYRQPVLGPVLAAEHLLAVAGLIALWLSKACGDGLLAKAGIGLAVFAGLAWAPAEIIFRFSRSPAEFLFGLAVPLTAVGLIIAGIAMLRVQRWNGWQRFLPLAIGLYILIVLLPALALKFERDLAIGMWGIGFVLLGVAIWVKEGRRAAER